MPTIILRILHIFIPLILKQFYELITIITPILKIRKLKKERLSNSIRDMVSGRGWAL